MGAARGRVAIIGGGIAGAGAAWALQRAGIDVTLYEAGPALGGNARVHGWTEGEGRIVTGLSVLAWPRAYFHNYEALLDVLAVEREATVPLRFFVEDVAAGTYWAQGAASPLGDELRPDFERWRRLVGAIRRSNRLFSRGGEPSLYRASLVNPANVVSLARAARAAGISRRFWETIVTAVHSTSFLTVELGGIPAVIAPTLDDIIGLAGDGSVLDTWSTSSAEVFERLSEGYRERLNLGNRVHRVERQRNGISVVSGRGAARFESVVFACSAPDALELLVSPSRLERRLLSAVEYVEARDTTFMDAVIHRDPSVLPATHREALLAGYANCIAVDAGPGGRRYTNTFIISSWAPAARGASQPMLVTYNPSSTPSSVEGRVKNVRAHPALSRRSLGAAMALRFVQGRGGIYYCGSYTTPGNGHDLSLLSGLVVAEQLGASYPFAERTAARADFELLRRMMVG